MSFYLIQILTGLSSAAILFLIASGLSLIFGVTRILNFAHGSLYMLGAYLAYTLTQRFGGNTFLGFWSCALCAILAVGLIGVVIEIVILRRIYHVPELYQLLATFGIVLIVQDITLRIWGPEDLLGPQVPGLAGSIRILGEPFPTYDLLLIFLALVVWGGLVWFLQKTRMGMLVRAATQDREILACLGTNQKWLFTIVFFIGSCLAGLAGALQLPRESVSLSMDMNIIIEAFVVVVIGGMGSIRGALVASIIVGLVQAFGVLVFPQITLVIVFLIMAVVLIFKPYGLFGKQEDAEASSHTLSKVQVLKVGDSRTKWIYGIGLSSLIIAPFFLEDYGLVLLTDILIFTLFACSLHFVVGPGGLGSFGHALYFGIGAYTAALCTKYLGTNMIWALLASPFIASSAGLAFGWFCVRSSGIYLAMLTFAFSKIVWAIAFQWYDVTGGDNGILSVWPSAWAEGKWTYYYLTLALVGISIGILRWTLFSPFGYALRAVRDSHLKASAIGIDIIKVQWLGLAFSGAFAGLAGCLFAYAKGSVFPSCLDVNTSVDAFVMTLMGGMSTLNGPIVGTCTYTLLKSEISRQTELWRAILGTIILVIIMFFPNGMVGTAQSLFNKDRSKK